MFSNLIKSGFSSQKTRVWGGLGLTFTLGLLAATRIPGVVQGFGSLRRDNIIDAALVIPTLTSEQILAFEIGDLMAPNEKMSAGPTSADVPGNLFVPEQSENYGIFPITIVKGEFGYYPGTATEAELATFSIQAPFSELVAKVRAKAPYKEILELVTLKRFGLTDKRDWSRVSRITTQLDRQPQTLGNYTWNRGTATATQADVVISFQETPNSRWMLGGLDTKPQTRGTVSGADGLTGLTKALFMRVENDANNSPIGGRGYFRNHTPTTPGNFLVDGVPAPLQSLKLEDKKVLRWTDPKVAGWVGVFRAKKAASMNLFYRIAEQAGNVDEDYRIKTTEQWVPGFSEEYALDQPLKADEELVVVFVGSATNGLRPMAMMTDPEYALAPVLESATEIRLTRIH